MGRTHSPTRRAVLSGAGAGLGALLLPACGEDPPLTAVSRARPSFVDLHCHAFNTQDIPLDQFLTDVLTPKLLKVPGWVLGIILEEISRLTRRTVERELKAICKRWPEHCQAIDAEHMAAFVEEPEPTDAEDEAAWIELQERLEAEASPVESAQLFPIFGAAKRLFLWLRLMSRYRFSITAKLVETYPEVDLFTPSTVDLAEWIGGSTQSPADQMKVWGTIARLPDFADKIRPMGSFCPRREDSVDDLSRAWRAGDVFGVKVYPPMGFAPDSARGTKIGRRLGELYELCEGGLPILTHGHESNGPSSSAEGFGHPLHWRQVVQQHEGLRVCLGHCGDVDDIVAGGRGGERVRAALDLIQAYPGRVFADLSFSSVGFADPEKPDEKAAAVFAALRSEIEGSEALGSGLCYGSDWHMIRRLKDQGEYAERARLNIQRYIAPDPETAADILGGNAARFLGGA